MSISRFCGKCGALQNSGAPFCRTCGASLARPQSSSSTGQQYPGTGRQPSLLTGQQYPETGQQSFPPTGQQYPETGQQPFPSTGQQYPGIAGQPLPSNGQQYPGTGRQPPGKILHGRYHLIQIIGQGGMGAVYIAHDMQLGNRLVALKEMSMSRLEPQEVPGAIQQFQQEAYLLASLQHPNLPTIYEYFSEDGRWYLVMSYINGQNLQSCLDQAPGHKFAVNEAARIGIELCTVLNYLHTHTPQIIFRDLKPLNILMTSTGQIYLIDFGIARHFKAEQTRDTSYYYSVGYASPEQYGTSQTSARSDIYSLGATLHQMLSGLHPANRPFHFAPLNVLDPTIPEPLANLVAKMVEMDEESRPASVALVKQELEQVLASPGIKETEGAKEGGGAGEKPGHTNGAQPPVVTGGELPPTKPAKPAKPPKGQKTDSSGTPPPQPPQKRPKRRRSLVIAAILTLIVLVVVRVGIYAATSSNQPSLPGGYTPYDQSTPTEQPTQAPTSFPSVMGTYTGTYQLSSSSTSDSLTLTINQQTDQNFGGTCVLNGSTFIITGFVDTSGNIQFSFTGTLTNTPVYNPVTFNGTAQGSRGWQGNFSGDGGNNGTWNAS